MDLSVWQEPLFWQIPIAAGLLSMTAFTIFAAPLTWLAWRDPPWARRWRIQQRPFHIGRFLGSSQRRNA
jgi:plant 4alpha-monomethylsterol monooxygenase